MSNDLISREMLLHTLEVWLKLNACVVPTEIGKAVYMMITVKSLHIYSTAKAASRW